MTAAKSNRPAPPDVAAAAELAERFVAPLGDRWLHVQAVAKNAEELGRAVADDERASLIAAAWLHDIGYSPGIGDTRFHPLDGARYLRASGWPDVVVNLVAHHSGARFEAAERGLSNELNDFPFADTPLLDALVTADMTTGPKGQSLTYDERIAEILGRYGEGHVVYRTWIAATPVIRQAVERTYQRIGETQPK